MSRSYDNDAFGRDSYRTGLHMHITTVLLWYAVDADLSPVHQDNLGW